MHYLSPLTLESLQWLHDAAAYCRVVVDGGEIVAFLLALREGGTYDSLNYRWFAQNYDRFLYIDRVVVASQSRGAGIGRLLYADVFAFAGRSQVAHVTCEYDIDPPNEASRRFHESARVPGSRHAVRRRGHEESLFAGDGPPDGGDRRPRVRRRGTPSQAAAGPARCELSRPFGHT